MFFLGLQNAATPETSAIAATVRAGVEWLRLAAELVGATIIGLGVVLAFVGFIRALALRQAAAFTDVRLQLGRYLALALEFELGADILSTAVSPSWDQIGKLGAIAVIRTALNFFLTRELREAGHAVSSVTSGASQSDPSGMPRDRTA